MQNLVAKHGKTVIVGGRLQGTLYEAVSDNRSRKAAKRYSGDAACQCYAKAYVILFDLGISDSSQNLSSSPSYADDMFHVHRRYDGRGSVPG